MAARVLPADMNLFATLLIAPRLAGAAASRAAYAVCIVAVSEFAAERDINSSKARVSCFAIRNHRRKSASEAPGIERASNMRRTAGNTVLYPIRIEYSVGALQLGTQAFCLKFSTCLHEGSPEHIRYCRNYDP